jgi:hypothetical protein
MSARQATSYASFVAGGATDLAPPESTYLLKYSCGDAHFGYTPPGICLDHIGSLAKGTRSAGSGSDGGTPSSQPDGSGDQGSPPAGNSGGSGSQGHGSHDNQGTSGADNQVAKKDLLGELVSVNFELQGLRGQPLLLAWSIFAERDQDQLSQAWLNNYLAYRLQATTDDDTGTLIMWIPIPEKPGPYFVRLTLASGSAGLASMDSGLFG